MLETLSVSHLLSGAFITAIQTRPITGSEVSLFEDHT